MQKMGARTLAELPGVDVVDLDGLSGVLARLGHGSLADVRSMVSAEVDGWMVEQRERSIAPTVTALRSRADEIVEIELVRLRARLSADGSNAADEAERMVHRVVDKLLHTPTVRVRELVDAPAESMSDALRLLFDLGPDDLVTMPELLDRKVRILKSLHYAELFERFLHSRTDPRAARHSVRGVQRRSRRRPCPNCSRWAPGLLRRRPASRCC